MRPRWRNIKHFVFPLWNFFLVAAVSLVPETALSYLSDGTEAENAFRTGNVTAKITEDFEPPDEIVPGEEIVKKVQIKNSGTQNCFVRCLIVPGNDIDKIHFEDDPEGMWRKNDDGYYYYQGMLEPGQSTVPVLSRVVVEEPGDTGEEEIRVIVYSESVLAEENVTPEEAFRKYMAKEEK